MSPIREVTTKRGSVAYQFVINTELDAKTNRPRRRKFSFATKQEAHEAYTRITGEAAKGTFVAPSKPAISRRRGKSPVKVTAGQSRPAGTTNTPATDTRHTGPATNHVPGIYFQSAAANN